MAEISQKTAIGKLDGNFITEDGIVTIDHKVRPDWLTIDGFTATPASTSTITTTKDLTGLLSVGMPLKYTIGGTNYYGIITAITNTLITIAGAPLSGSITTLAFGNASRVAQVDFFVSGKFSDASNTNLLATDMLTAFKWNFGPAKLVRILAKVSVDDSGATQPKVNMTVGGNAVCTSNTNAGLTISESFVSTVVDINIINYNINAGSAIELSTDGTGTNKDAEGLTMSGIFVII